MNFRRAEIRCYVYVRKSQVFEPELDLKKIYLEKQLVEECSDRTFQINLIKVSLV